jgi:hypothetical protein
MYVCFRVLFDLDLDPVKMDARFVGSYELSIYMYIYTQSREMRFPPWQSIQEAYLPYTQVGPKCVSLIPVCSARRSGQPLDVTK